MIKSGIYMIQNIVNKKVYIGSSKNMAQRKWSHFKKLRKNRHENSYLQNSFNKYGEDKFIFSILRECEKELLGEEEKKFINQYDALNRERGYNICPDINNKTVADETRKKLSILARNRTKEHRKKLSIARTGWNPSEETRKKMSSSHIGYIMPEEQKRKIGEASKGRKVSEESRAKMSISKKGIPKSEEHKRKISQTLTGRIMPEAERLKLIIAKRNMSEATKQKIREYRTGKKHTEETKRKMSEIRLSYFKKIRGKSS
jgi:group I intron endonuclease